MLRLREQIGGDPARIDAVVGGDDDLGRAGDGVDADVAEHQPLGRGDVGVAGADDLVDARHALGAVRHRGDRLRAADHEHAVDAGQPRGRQRLRRRARRGHHDLAHARDARRDGGHDHRRRIPGLAARHVDADAGQRIDAAADAHAFLGDLVGGVPLALVKHPDALRGAFHRRAHLGRRARRELVPLGRRQLERVELALVELRGQRAHGGVAPRAHLGDHSAALPLRCPPTARCSDCRARRAGAGSRGSSFRIPGSWLPRFEVRQNSSLRPRVRPVRAAGRGAMAATRIRPERTGRERGRSP